MTDQSVIHMSGMDCPPQDDEKFNQWYNEIHIPLLLKFKGLLEINRYKVLTKPTDQPQYITTYKFANRQDLDNFLKSPERQAAINQVKESWPNGLPTRFGVQYELIKSVKR